METLIEEARLRERIASLEAENARLARMLSDGGAVRGPAASSLMQARLADTERELAEARASEAVLHQTIEDVRNSFSWQLTAPLRAFKKLFSRR
ncbi:MAG: hypothetical protein QM648_10270 [Solirubrobacterales bacterium]